MRKVRVAPKGMGLNDFVAQEEGFFAAEGIEVEWDIKTFRGTQASWKGLDYKSRPQDKPYTEAKEPHPVRVRLGQHLQRQRRHGPLRARLLRRLALGHLRAPGLQDPQAAGSGGRSGLGRHARRQPFQRALPAGESPAAGKDQGGE